MKIEKTGSNWRAWRWLSISLLVALMIFSGVSASNGAAQDEGQRLLGRLDVDENADLEALTELKLEIFEQLHKPQGGFILLFPADPETQSKLQDRGYKVQILESAGPNENFYLVYGLEDDLAQIAAVSPILTQSGRQAAIKASPDQADEIAKLGFGVRMLQAHRLIAQPVEVEENLAYESLSASPIIQDMIDQVDSNKLFSQVGGLSGEWPVTIRDNPYTLSTRYTLAYTPITKATRLAYEYFQNLGIPVDYHYYSTSTTGERRNVVAEQTGVTQPERIYLLVAHLDSTALDQNPMTLAPGADDNASGSAAVMQIAEILSQYNFGCTLRYVLFTGEEQGLYGSWAYAQLVYNQGQDIAGVLNLDMLAYNTPGSAASIELNTRYDNGGDIAIAKLFRDVVYAYQINLNPMILQEGNGFSDHYPFWSYGYPAILAIEDWNDHTPYYHTTLDQLESLNMGYYTEFVKAALGTFAHMGCLAGELRGTIRDGITSAPIANAQVEAHDTTQMWTTSTQNDGSYQLPLPPSSYLVRVSAPLYMGNEVLDVQINPGQITNLDLSLQLFPYHVYLPLTANSLSPSK